ncbi:MAG: flagellar hook-length control protein FliK [Bacteroidales bacterium]
MTVTSINKRAVEQPTNMTPASTAPKSAQEAAAEFSSALQQATSSLFSSSAARAPSANAALQGHFARSKADDDAKPQADDKAARAEVKPAASHGRSRDDDKAVRRNDKVKADKADKADAKADKVETKDDDAQPAQAADDTAVTDDNGQDLAQGDAAPQQDVQPQAVAAVVEAPVQQVQAVADAPKAEVQDKVEADAAQGETKPQAAAQQTANDQSDAQDAQADAGDDAAVDDTLTAADAQTAAKAAHHKQAAKADANDQARAQADDLAQRLDDTGAQLNVQVRVSNAAAQSQNADTDAVTTPVAAQDTAAPVLPANGQGNASADQSGNKDAGLAAAAQPAAANAGNAAPQADATQGKAFDAILAAQAEATTGPQADVHADQPQTAQPIAALNGAGGTAAAQKAQAPQAAQAPRQPQMPQAKEVMEQVSVQIAKQSKDGGDTIKVQLKPTELGSIEIKLDVAKDGTVTTVVTADNKDTLDLLKKDQSSLQKALEDAGLKSDTGSMTFNLREGNQQQANQNNLGNGSGSGRRRARLEAAAAADAASAKAAAAAQARWGMSRSGVDIQV